MAASRKSRRPSETAFAGRALGGSTLHGELDAIGVHDLLRVPVARASSGRLLIYDDSFDAELYYELGRLVAALSGAITGQECLKQVLLMREGSFEFVANLRVDPARMVAGLHELMLALVKDYYDKTWQEQRRTSGATEAIYPATSGVHKVERPVAGFINDPSISPKENNMTLESHLQSLRDVKGYKASAIMNFTGEPLATDSVDQSVDLSLVGATFNDIFRSAHEASKKIGLDATREAVFKTPKGLIIMQCSGVDARVHIHMISVLSEDGNQALAKMRLDQMVPKIVAEL